jgi:hypothetical protein
MLFINLYCLICTFFTGTNHQKKQLFVMAICISSGTTLPRNLAIIPSEQLAFPELYSIEVCSWSHVVEYRSFELLIETSEVFSRSRVMICTFHGILMAFKKDELSLLDEF